MKVKINPKRLSGTLQAIPSKSLAHRHFIANFLSKNPKGIRLEESSVDIETTKLCLSSLKKREILNCKESGSTLRFLLPLSAVLKDEAEFSLSRALALRPLYPLVKEMEKHGCEFSGFDKFPENEQSGKKGRKPKAYNFTVKGKLKPGTFTLPGNISTQYISGLMFALPLLDGDSKILLTGPLETPAYVDMTIAVLKKYGVMIESSPDEFVPGYIIRGNQKYISPESIEIEGDWSSGSAWLAAGAMCGAVSVLGLNTKSLQGDIDIVEILKNFGAFVTPSQKGVLARTKDLFGIEIDISNTPDLMPIVSVLATAAYGDTHIFNGKKLRYKESDRIHSMAVGLKALGASLEEREDGLIIHGKGYLNGGSVSSFNDHRIVMALSLASCICKTPVIIDGAEAIAKSYPKFFTDFKKLGGDVHAI